MFDLCPLSTYTANGQAEANSVEYCGGDSAVVEGVADAVIITEKAPLVRADLTQVKGRQRQTPCGGRDQEGGRGGGQRSKQYGTEGQTADRPKGLGSLLDLSSVFFQVATISEQQMITYHKIMMIHNIVTDNDNA